MTLIKGQVEGIVKMLDESDDPTQILNQFKAANKGFEKAQYLLLDEVFRKALAMKIAEALETCPGNCGQEERIAIIREQFPDLRLYELTDKMKEINKVYEFLLKEKNNLNVASFEIDNMNCKGCTEKVTDILKEISGVVDVEIQPMIKLVTVKYNSSLTDENIFVNILTNIGYKPTKN